MDRNKTKGVSMDNVIEQANEIANGHATEVQQRNVTHDPSYGTITSCSTHATTVVMEDTEEWENLQISTPLLIAPENSDPALLQNNQMSRPHDQDSAESSNSAIMMLILIATTTGAIVILPIFTSCTRPDMADHVHHIGSLIRDIFVVLIGIIATLFVFKQRQWTQTRWIKTNPTTFGNGALLEHGNSSAIETRCCQKIRQTPSISLFAIFTLVSTICTILEFIIIHSPFQDPSKYFIAIASFVVYLLVLAAIILFNTCYFNVILQTCSFFYNTISLMIGGVFCIWLSAIFQELYVLARCREEDVPETNTSIQPDNIARIYYVFEVIQSFLAPFAIEFYTITIGLLIRLWNTMVEKHEIVEEINNNITTTSSTPLTSENLQTPTSNKSIQIMLVALSLVVAVCYVASYIILSGTFKNSFTTLSGEIYIWEGIKFGLYLPQCVLIICWWKTRSANRLRLSKLLTSKDYFLLGLNIVVYFYGNLRVFCALTLLIYPESDIEDRPSNGEVIAVLLFAIFGIIQVYVQSRYLLMAHREQTHVGNISSINKCLLLYTGSLNIAEWFILSLGHLWLEKSHDSLFPLFTYVFGELTTAFVKVLFFPVITFYNFHCAVLSYEIYKEI